MGWNSWGAPGNYGTGVDPLTGKFYVAGQQVNIVHPKKPTGGGGPGVHYIPKNSYDPAGALPRAGVTPSGNYPEMADKAGWGNIAQQQAADLSTILGVDGQSLPELLAAYGLGPNASPTTTTRTRAAVPTWSQADVNKLTEAGQSARTNIGGAWDAASAQLQKLMSDYAAADAARRQGAAQTLGAFGAPTAQDVGGMSAADLLASMLGQVQVSKAAELSNQDALIQAYASLLGKAK